MNIIINTQDAIEAIRAGRQDHYNRQERIIRAAWEGQNDMAPTIDQSGRYHAPCDGYNWDGVVYGAGEFLPTGDEYEAGNIKGAPTKIVATLEAAQTISDAIPNCTMSKPFDKEGVPHVFLSLETIGTVRSRLAKLAGGSLNNEKVLALAEEGGTGKTWADSVGKIVAKLDDKWFGTCLSDKLHDLVIEWKEHKVDTGKSKVMKVEIGYQYRTVLIG